MPNELIKTIYGRNNLVIYISNFVTTSSYISMVKTQNCVPITELKQGKAENDYLDDYVKLRC